MVVGVVVPLVVAVVEAVDVGEVVAVAVAEVVRVAVRVVVAVVLAVTVCEDVPETVCDVVGELVWLVEGVDVGVVDNVVERDVVADVDGVVIWQPTNKPSRRASIIRLRTIAVSVQNVSSCSRPWKQPTSCGLPRGPVNASIAALIAEDVCVHADGGPCAVTARS